MKLIIQSALVGVVAAQQLLGFPAAPVYQPYRMGFPAAPVYQPYRTMARAAPIQYAPRVPVDPYALGQSQLNLNYVQAYRSGTTMDLAAELGVGGGSLSGYLYSNAYETSAQAAKNDLDSYTGNDAFERQQLQYSYDSAKQNANSFTYPLLADAIGGGSARKFNDLAAIEGVRSWNTAKIASDAALAKLIADNADAADIEAAKDAAQIDGDNSMAATLGYLGNEKGSLFFVTAAETGLRLAKEGTKAAVDGGDAHEIAVAKASQRSAKAVRDARLFGFMGNGKAAAIAWFMGAQADQDYYDLTHDALIRG